MLNLLLYFALYKKKLEKNWINAEPFSSGQAWAIFLEYPLCKLTLSSLKSN